MRGRASAAVAFIALAVLVTGTASYFAFLPQSAGTVAFWVIAVGPSLLLAALAAVWASRDGLLREWFAPAWGDFTSGVLGAMVLFLAAWGFARLVTPVGSPREIWLVSLYGEIGDPRVLQAHTPAVAATVAAAAVAEEMVWRGMVTQLLAERVGSRTAWLWAAGLYAVSYVPSAWSLRAMNAASGTLNPVLPLAALGGGLLWGWMARGALSLDRREQRPRGRLLPSILAHALFDWAVIMMFPLWGAKQGA